MKKKNIKILLIIIGVIMIIPISVFATNTVKKLIGPPVVKEQSREEVREELEKEKQEWIKEHKNENNITTIIYSNEDENELQKKKETIEQTEKQLEEIMINAMTRIYPNEFPELLAEIKELNEKDPNYNLGKITETDYKLYNLIFEAMENNQFTEEEKEVFKEFMSDQYNVIKVDEDLRNKCEKFEIKHY